MSKVLEKQNSACKNIDLHFIYIISSEVYQKMNNCYRQNIPEEKRTFEKVKFADS
jgi:hypothetical protein